MRGFITTIIFIFSFLSGSAQGFIVKGYVRDAYSEEPIPLASVILGKKNIGQLTDSAGKFLIRSNAPVKGDTLLVSYVGFQTKKISLNNNIRDTVYLQINLERGVLPKEVVVKSKHTKGWMLWRRVVKRKEYNNRARFENYSYELYNKLEIDINRLNVDKFVKRRLIRPFGSIIEQSVDTISEEKPFLPMFLSETISDFYYQSSPFRKREEIKASRSSGINNESLLKMLGGMNLNDNVYNNYLNVFNKRFISPIADNGDVFYHYRLPDTQYVAGKRLLHLIFAPKHRGENTFDGECWIHDSTYAVQKVILNLSKEANINFINRFSLVQEYKWTNDSIWFVNKDKLIVDFAPVGKENFGFISRKTTTYKNIQINKDYIGERVRKNSILEEVVFLDSSKMQNEVYWQEKRHEDLSKNEKAIYVMIDTIQKMPAFKRFKNTIEFVATGYISNDNFQFGPWFNAISTNPVEGLRLRFDLSTSNELSKRLKLRTYIAYGTLDQQYKGNVQATYLLRKNPRSHIFVSYVDDYDNGQAFRDEVSSDNVFSIAARKIDVPIKFLRIRQERFEFFKETKTGFSIQMDGTRKRFIPLRSLPDASVYAKSGDNNGLTNTEVSIKLRLAYMERFIEGDFARRSMGSRFPIGDIKYSRGLKGVFGGSYNYDKLVLTVQDNLRLAHYGEFSLNLFAGKIWGMLPFPLLEVHPGNEIYYYNKYAYNLMDRFEYLSDEYAGMNIEHNMGAGMFRLFGPSRKFKLRQFWNAKILWGRLSEKNKSFNQFGTVFENGHTFKSLDQKPYMELGTGVSNIFKFIRVDVVWRVLPQPFPKEFYKQFGVFGSFQLQF